MRDAAEGPVFPGSRDAAGVVAWIDRVLLDLREGRVADARALLDSEGWRALHLDGTPLPIRNQLHAGLYDAAAALARPHAPMDEAEQALLIARARFLPGG
jgi:hypothetical protein